MFSSSDTVGKLRQGLGIGLFSAFITVAAFLSGIFEPLEMISLDARFGQIPRSAANKAPPGIVMVTIDQDSLDATLAQRGHRWPWPRMFYGLMVEYLTAVGARGVVFDMYFTEPDIARLELDSAESDDAFIEAVKASGRVYSGYLLKKSGQGLDPEKQAAFTSKLDKYKGVITSRHLLDTYGYADFPLAPLAEGSRAVGFLNMPLDNGDTARRSMLMAAYSGNPDVSKDIAAVSLALTVAWDIAGCPEIELKNNILRFSDKSVPVDNEGNVYLWWYKSEKKDMSPFESYPAHNVLNAAVQYKSGKEPSLPASVFKNKIVYIGSTAQGLHDRKSTPVSGDHTVPGMEVQATAIANLLMGDHVRRTGRASIVIVLFLVSVVTAMTVRSCRKIVYGILPVVLLLPMVWLAGYWFLASQHVFVDVVPLVSGIALAFVTATLINYLSEQRHSKLVRGIFEHYLDRSIVSSLIAEPEKVKLGGESRTCTVIFSDVASFTSTSEMLTPEKVVEFMNVYLNAMTEIIISEGGFVDKYVGDEIVAIFGAPEVQPDHALRACRAIVRMQERITELQPEFTKIGCAKEIFARAGVSTGTMVVGNMGSVERMNYTAMGDAMNLGARLEGTNKIYGTLCTVSDNTAQAAGDEFVFRELDLVQVKGKKNGVKVYELVGVKGSVPGIRLELIGKFSKGLELYRAGRWQEALDVFVENAEKGDVPAVAFAERCREFMVNPPEEDWGGIYVMKVK